MPATDRDFDRVAIDIDGPPRCTDARRRLHRELDLDVLAGGHATKNAASMIGQESLRGHLVTMLTAMLAHHTETIADLDAFDSVDRHHRLGDVRIQPVEHRFTQPRRHAGREH